MYEEAAWIPVDVVAPRSVRCTDEEERCNISVQNAKEEEMNLKKKMRQQRK